MTRLSRMFLGLHLDTLTTMTHCRNFLVPCGLVVCQSPMLTLTGYAFLPAEECRKLSQQFNMTTLSPFQNWLVHGLEPRQGPRRDGMGTVITVLISL